jgi:hypothetical protein
VRHFGVIIVCVQIAAFADSNCSRSVLMSAQESATVSLGRMPVSAEFISGVSSRIFDLIRFVSCGIPIERRFARLGARASADDKQLSKLGMQLSRDGLPS